MELFTQNPYWTIAAVAVLLNIPMGYLREATPKFSLNWFFWIHASIPFLIYLRLAFHSSKLFIPVAIFLAIVGQLIGSRLRRRKMTVADKERLAQINDLKIPAPAQTIPDSDVTIVLMNMGGPENIAGVRPFLRRLFLDRRILRFPLAVVLQPFFAWLIIAIRGKATEHRYSLIGGGSPILKSTLAQRDALQRELHVRGRKMNVEICFNYSSPLPSEAVAKIKNSERRHIFPLSLYPHYSEATTGSNLFYLKEESKKSFPEAIFLESQTYYLDNNYIDAFVDRVNETLKPGESLENFYVLFSAHGLPLYFLVEGDPYPFQIAQTIGKVLERLNRRECWSVSYQSAVGPLVWLKPSTGDMIHALARRGIKKLLVVPISFVTDHIETTCEIDIEYRAVAEKLGIADFRMSKALECHQGFITALADCAEGSLDNIQQVLTK